MQDKMFEKVTHGFVHGHAMKIECFDVACEHSSVKLFFLFFTKKRKRKENQKKKAKIDEKIKKLWHERLKKHNNSKKQTTKISFS